MSEKTKEETLPNVGDLLPYTNTHGKICIGEVTELVDLYKNGKKMWWRGFDKQTGACVYYPVRTSLCLQAYADQEKRSTAIAFQDWTQFLYIPYKMKEGLYYHRKDLLKHIDEATVLTTDQVYDAYLIHLQSLPKTV